MLINTLFLAISSSIDSLGIGVTYGIKNTKISYIGKTILLLVSFAISLLSINFGNLIKNILTDILANTIGSLIFILIGILVCFQVSPDFDNSNSIDPKEALFLGLALSLDSFCIGIGGSFIGINSILFPIFIASFQFIFLHLGNFLGRKLNKLSFLPSNTWSTISGLLLITLGIAKFVF